MLPNRSSGPGPTPLVVFGKAPWMGDFIRLGTPSRAGDALEQWVEQGLTRAEARLGGTWASAYTRGAMQAFVFRPPRSTGLREALVGVIVPSTDAAGRRFPLLVYAHVSLAVVEDRWPHVLPMALGEFFDGAAAALQALPGFSSMADLVEALRPLPPPELRGTEVEARDYDAWTSAALLGQAWNVIYGRASAVLAPQAMHVIADAVAPFHGEAAPATTLGLRLPLGSGGVAAAAFWLDVLRRLSGTRGEARTCFWSFDGTHGSMIVQLGDTPTGTLAELWAPDADSAAICDLTEAPNVDVRRLVSELPRPIVDAMQAPETRVCEFLDRLGR